MRGYYRWWLWQEAVGPNGQRYNRDAGQERIGEYLDRDDHDDVSFIFSGLLGKTKLSNLKRFFFCITYYGYPALIKCWKRLQEDEDDEEENNDGAEDDSELAMMMITTLAFIKDIGSTEKILLFPNVRRTNPAVCLSVCSSNQILVMMMMMVVMMIMMSVCLSVHQTRP